MSHNQACLIGKKVDRGVYQVVVMTHKILIMRSYQVFWRTLISLALLITFITSASAQDVVIYSKKSDEISKQLQELVNALNDKEVLKILKLSNVNAETAVSTEYTGKSFEVDESLAAKAEELTNTKLTEFSEKAKKIDKKEVKAQVPLLKDEYIKIVTEELDKLKAGGLDPLNEAIKKLNAESKINNERFKALKAAEPADEDKVIAGILKALKDNNEEAVIKSNGEATTEIKKMAEEMTNKQAEEKYPFPDKKKTEAEAVKKYPKFKVGDKVQITYFPTPNRPQKASGAIRSITQDKITVGFAKVNIDDIADPIMRDGMRSDVTDKNRKDYVDNIFQDIRKARTKYYNENLQVNVDKIIAGNEKNGFILTAGKWQTAANYTSSLLSKKISDWKNEKLDVIEKAILEDGKLLNSVEGSRDGYNAPPKAALELFTKKIDQDSEQVILQMTSVNNNVDFTEEDIKKFEEQEAARKAAEAEAAKKKAEEDKKRKQAIKEKERLVKEQNEKPAETGSGSMILIGVVLLLIGGAAFVFFNPKLRNKLLPGGKKKSMQDVLSNLNAPGAPQPEGGLPMPGGPVPPQGGGVAPPPGVPAGMSAPAGGENEKTKIDLDGDVSIVKRDSPEEAPQAAPRKKISLNLGSSTTSLSQDSAAPAASDAGTTQESIDSGSIGGLKPPGGGGLTPPGGGLKPPGAGGLTPPGGGGLTPPGGGQAPESDDSGGDPENQDKSNLILNPNLDGSGTKLRLKK